MAWKPDKTLGLGVGLVVVLVIIGMEAFLLQSMLDQPPGLNLYVMALLFVLSVPLLVLWLYWYYGLVTLRYTMDRDALVIACGASRYVVPMDAIQRVVRGDEVAISQGFRGVGWPGYLMGSLRLRELGLMLVASTEPVERQLIIVTERMCYGVSPRQPGSSSRISPPPGVGAVASRGAGRHLCDLRGGARVARPLVLGAVILALWPTRPSLASSPCATRRSRAPAATL